MSTGPETPMDRISRSFQPRTTASHTPGPWSVGEYAPGGDTLVIDSEYGILVRDAGRADSKVAQANARLIAEAPAMLEALRDQIEAVEAYLAGPPHVSLMNDLTDQLRKSRAILARIDEN